MTSRGLRNCSGDMNGGVPSTRPMVTVSVWLSTAREMPKSIPGITTSAGDGSGSEGSEVNSLEVFVDGSEDPVSVELPGGSVYMDGAAQVASGRRPRRTP
ncbi:hypothetical protein SANTM175S_10955 [Streptomyces antimycoticus]